MIDRRHVPPYSGYARVYDLIGQRAFGERMAAVVMELLAARGRLPRTVLDLGCGTGSATLVFARAGLDATGVDIAPEMLEIARRHAAAQKLSARFFEADMTRVELAEQFDLVTCVYDAFNYLDDAEAAQRFVRTSLARLTPTGTLVFDMNTRSRLESSWEQGLVLAGDSAELYVTYRSWFDASIDASPLVVTGFVRDETNCWRRFDEEHIERAWPIAMVREWLEAGGFQSVDVLGYVDATGELIHPALESHGRVLFLASR